MITANNKILVSVNYSQKSNIEVVGSSFLLAKDFNENRRESMPVMCEVINGNESVKEGTVLLVHHNRFDENSPHHLGDNLYSLAYNSSIFARIDEQGNAKGLCDNILVEQINPSYSSLLPPDLRKPDKFKYKVINNGFGFKKGQTIFAYEFANYEIIYVFKGVERRVIKISKNDIVGKVTQ